MSTKVTWRGDKQVKANMDAYADKVRHAVVQVANYWAPVIETAAKQDAPWTDRTANARQSLHAFVEELSQDVVVLYLSHGVSYGLFLEIRWAGKFSIIWPTIESHLPEIEKMLRGIFK